MGRSWRVFYQAAVLIVSFAALGCGSDRPETAEVTGTVTIDGKPLTQGSVVFNPEHGWPAYGKIDSEGRFVLSTYDDGDGASVGSHRVTVTAQTGGDETLPFEGKPTEPIRSLIPERYGNKATSGLQVEVKSGIANQADLVLTSKARG